MKIHAILLALLPLAGQAATIITYTATNGPGSSPDANITYNGSGSADVWTLGGSGGGDFLGNSADNGDNSNVGGTGAGSSAWAMYSSASQNKEAVHTFAGGALSVGQGIELDFDNGYLNGSAVVGVSLWNSSNQNLFEYFFTGGQSFYQKNDLGGVSLTSKAFTDNGFKFSFLLNSASTYTGFLGGDAISGSLINPGAQDISKIRVFTYNNPGPGSGDNDLFFNNLAVTPEPSRALLALIGLVGMSLRRRRA